MTETVFSSIHYDPDTGEFTRIGGQHAGRPVGALRSDGYVRIRFQGKRYYAQVLAWYLHEGEWPSYIVDHINGNRADNRWCNLRLATRAENNRNCRIYSNNTSGVKGVSRAYGKWKAELFAGDNYQYLGLFESLEDAAKARREAAEKVYGQFAREEEPEVLVEAEMDVSEMLKEMMNL